jgi:hypothetical protein
MFSFKFLGKCQAIREIIYVKKLKIQYLILDIILQGIKYKSQIPEKLVITLLKW